MDLLYVTILFDSTASKSDTKSTSHLPKKCEVPLEKKNKASMQNEIANIKTEFCLVSRAELDNQMLTG